jgi:cellobiose phosphorylase
VRHGSSPANIATYMVEPYVAAADVLAVAPHTGRGGWTWYTGSAGWMYRLIIESLLGLHREGDTLVLKPRLPQAWPTLHMQYRFGATQYQIALRREPSDGPMRVVLDGTELADARVALSADGGVHRVEIVLPH